MMSIHLCMHWAEGGGVSSYAMIIVGVYDCNQRAGGCLYASPLRRFCVSIA